MISGVKNFKQAIMPLVWLNCIFCMGIFEIPINRSRYFLSVFYVISIMTGYFITLYKVIYIFQKGFKFDFMILYFFMGTNVLVAALVIILFWWKAENMNIIIKRNSIADNTLEELGIKIDYQKDFCSILFFMAIWSISTIAIVIMCIIWLHDTVGCWSALYSGICASFPIVINSVTDLTFASFIRCLQIKFQQTNTLINNAMRSANESNAFKIHHRHKGTSIVFVIANYKNHEGKILHLMQTLRHLHLEMTKIGRQINYTYSLELLFELAIHFMSVTSSIYTLYAVFSGQLHMTLNNKKIIIIAIWGSLYLLKIVSVNWLCACVSTEAHKTATIIQSFEGTIINNDMREEIQQFTQQIMLNSLNFTAAGFFPIDNSLTAKFIATVSTYVVILIQMNTHQIQFVQHNDMSEEQRRTARENSVKRTVNASQTKNRDYLINTL